VPGLLGGIARTAVIAGTATVVSNRVSRRQANRWAQQDAAAQPAAPQYAAQPAPPQPPAPPAAPAAVDTVSQLQGLAGLKAQGILTSEEFEAQKAKILAL
jgi:hypothetical protein